MRNLAVSAMDKSLGAIFDNGHITRWLSDVLCVRASVEVRRRSSLDEVRVTIIRYTRRTIHQNFVRQICSQCVLEYNREKFPKNLDLLYFPLKIPYFSPKNPFTAPIWFPIPKREPKSNRLPEVRGAPFSQLPLF